MANLEPIYPSISKLTYSFSEAIEYIKIRDNYPTNIDKPVIWKDVKTGIHLISAIAVQCFR